MTAAATVSLSNHNPPASAKRRGGVVLAGRREVIAEILAATRARAKLLEDLRDGWHKLDRHSSGGYLASMGVEDH